MAASSSAHVDAESKNIVLITGGVEWDQIGGKDVTKGCVARAVPLLIRSYLNYRNK